MIEIEEHWVCPDCGYRMTEGSYRACLEHPSKGMRVCPRCACPLIVFDMQLVTLTGIKENPGSPELLKGE